MFALSTENQFHLYSQPTDMRKSFNGLSGIITNELERSPLQGEVFLFINKKRDKIKLLHYSPSGYILYYKCLEEGTFELPDYNLTSASIHLDYAQMVMLIDGLSIKNIKRRKRYQPRVKKSA